jgi:hypothetical protein
VDKEYRMQKGKVRYLTSVLATGALVVILQGCGSEGKITSLEGSSTVTLSVEGLEPLSGGMNYQAWLMAGAMEQPWGYPLLLFNINENGELVDPAADTVLTGPFPAQINADGVFGIAISLENAETLQAYSSFSFILGAQFAEGSGSLSTAHWIAFNTSLTEATGQFVLRTPTDEDPENETSGVWFLDPTVTPTGTGLNLPEAPEGWTYESWVMVGDQPLSMGKFFVPDAADSTGTYSGALSPPDFPGEDFLTGAPAGLTFPLDLSGASVMVTMEPWAQWDLEPEAPFFLRLFELEIPAGAEPETPFEMTSLVSHLPTGTATIQSP